MGWSLRPRISAENKSHTSNCWLLMYILSHTSVVLLEISLLLLRY